MLRHVGNDMNDLSDFLRLRGEFLNNRVRGFGLFNGDVGDAGDIGGVAGNRFDARRHFFGGDGDGVDGFADLLAPRRDGLRLLGNLLHRANHLLADARKIRRSVLQVRCAAHDFAHRFAQPPHILKRRA